MELHHYVIEWRGYAQIQLETGSFTVLEHKTKICLFACQNMLNLALSKVHSQNVHAVTTNINVTVHINKH